MLRRRLLWTGVGAFFALVTAVACFAAPSWYERHRLGQTNLEGATNTKVTDLYVMPLSTKEFADGATRWRDTYTGDIRLATVRNGKREWRHAWSVTISGTPTGSKTTVRINR